MKIMPEQKQVINEYKSHTEVRGIEAYRKQMNPGAARLDINNINKRINTFGDVYESHGVKDIGELLPTDVETNSKALVVMSNTMSEEDYNRAVEGGFDPSEMTGEEASNILDHIKIALAQSGKVVAGFNDDMTGEEIKNITGSTGEASAVKARLREADLPDSEENTEEVIKALELGSQINISEGSIKYMVLGEMEPTIENLYTAGFSAQGDGMDQARGYFSQSAGYMAMKADTIDMEAIEKQLENNLLEMDLSISDEEAKELSIWLIEKGVPLTKENILSLKNIKDIEIPPKDSTIRDAAVIALSEGKKATEGNLSPNYKGDFKAAGDILKALENRISREENRLRMSLGCALKMAGKGINIDTCSMDELLNNLKREEKELKQQMFGDLPEAELDSKTDLFFDTINQVKELPELPLATVGVIGLKSVSYETIQNYSDTGKNLKADFEKAGQSYETLMTSPRRDMGDSIKKAFRNVDSILEEMKLPQNDENRRAVRILGYNSMEITDENIDRIKETDRRLMNVISNLNPARVLKLIRDGINPLETSMEELEETIRQMELEPKKQEENFARFLQKLDKSNEITPQERDAYIGIYRIINRLERTDYAALGAIVESNSELNFKELLTNIRSRNKNIDVAVEEGFGFLTEKVEKGISITAQIEAAFEKQIGTDKAREIEKQVRKENCEHLKEILKETEKSELEALLNLNQRVTPENLEAFREMNSQYGNMFLKLKELQVKNKNHLNKADKSMEEILSKASKDFVDKLQDREKAKAEYSNLMDICRREIDNQENSSIDIKSINIMYKQISLSTSMSAEESYHVPVMVEGSISSMRIHLIHGKDKGKIEISLVTATVGKIHGELSVSEDFVEGLFYGEEENREIFGNIKKEFLLKADKEGFKTGEIIFTSNKFTKFVPGHADNNNVSDTGRLYRVARMFIDSIQ